MSDNRTQVLCYGGGTQSVCMTLLAVEGILPMPDVFLCANTSREATSTWDYLNKYVQPLLGLSGRAVEIAPHSLATVDLYSHKGTLLLPVYTATGKFSTYCTGEWKASVNERYLRSKGIRSADSWIGFSVDETRREKPPGNRVPLREADLEKNDRHPKSGQCGLGLCFI